MRIDFYEPPAAQKVGGLDQAIRSLQNYLVSDGFSVQPNPAPTDAGILPDIVHFHGLWQRRFPSVSRRCRKLGIPYLVSPHGMLEPWAWRHKRWKKLPYYYLRERFHLQNAGTILATSDQEAANLLRFFAPKKITTVPLGLPDGYRPDRAGAREKLGWKPEELILLFLSRIHPKKGLDLLLQALCSVTNALPKKWRLVIVGDGERPYTSTCQKLIQENAIIFQHTEWKGPIWGEEKWLYYQGADLFCLPSFSENFGLAILEACQVGTRTLITPNTPWSFLEDVGAAFLVDPKVELIQKGLIAFLKSPVWSQAERDELSRQIHDRFGWRRIGPLYTQLYRQLVSSVIPDDQSAS